MHLPGYRRFYGSTAWDLSVAYPTGIFYDGKEDLDIAQIICDRTVSKLIQAALDQAKAQLLQAEAQFGKARLDNEIQAKLGAQAQVEAARANVEQAELNMEWTKVTSLVSGIAGVAQVQIESRPTPDESRGIWAEEIAIGSNRPGLNYSRMRRQGYRKYSSGDLSVKATRSQADPPQHRPISSTKTRALAEGRL